MELTSVPAFLDYWEKVRGRTERVAECIPADRLEWTWQEGKFSLGDLVRHLAGIERYMYAENVQGLPSRYPGHGRELADGLEAVRGFLDRCHAESVAIFARLTDERLREKCETPGGASLAIGKWLRLMIEHEIHHRGQTFTGGASAFTGPAGPSYVLDDGVADYGAAAAGAASDCYDATPAHDCYEMSVTGTRPAPHWDATFDEALASALPEFTRTWTLHIGGSFPDVPTSQQFYPYIENLFHNGITGGCGAGAYCPEASVSRGQMAVFLIKSEHGAAYAPPACGGIFGDVSCSSPFAAWIEQLFHEGITGGCGAGVYCPAAPVTRAQMAVFLLKTTLGSVYVPPACTGTVFGDVPCTGGAFDPWIEDLAGRGITGGCGGGNYCPDNPNNRGQMAAFLVRTFGLQLYGP